MAKTSFFHEAFLKMGPFKVTNHIYHYNRCIFIIAISIYFCFIVNLAECVPEKPKRSALNQLTRTLLRKYDSGVRPVHNWTSSTTVYIDLILQSVLDVVCHFNRFSLCCSLNCCGLQVLDKYPLCAAK